jgi:hypothetical protein
MHSPASHLLYKQLDAVVDIKWRSRDFGLTCRPTVLVDKCHSVVVIGLQPWILTYSWSETLLGDDILIRYENNCL